MLPDIAVVKCKWVRKIAPISLASHLNFDLSKHHAILKYITNKKHPQWNRKILCLVWGKVSEVEERKNGFAYPKFD